MKIKHLPLLFALFFSAGAIANDAEILRCGAITDSVARLTCYDALARSVREGKPTATKPAVVPKATTPAPVAAAPTPATPAAVAVAPAAAAAPSSLPKQTTQQFGFEQRATTDELNYINSEIVGNFDGWEPTTRITLSNGQVWQIADGSGRYVNLKSPQVRIRRGILGAFYIEFDGTNHSPKVRRIQ
ncbi:MAG: hypothetical protein JNN20_20185 [Betaproteobacteria bacterium]|nr:hypothetical protein [Betaproteobacteria bacterium]